MFPLLTDYEKKEKKWNAGIPGAWCVGQDMYHAKFQRISPARVDQFLESHFSIAMTHFKAFREALSSVMGRMSTPCKEPKP